MNIGPNSDAWGVVREIQDTLAVLIDLEQSRAAIEREALHDGDFDVIYDEAVKMEPRLVTAQVLWKRTQLRVTRLLEMLRDEAV